MSAEISIGLDFGSLKYRAAYILDEAIVPVPTPAADTTWIGSIMLQPTQTGLTFSSLKYQLGTGEPMSFRGKRETVEDVVKDKFLTIKQSVEEYAGENIGHVVISVPARYSAYRRSETVKIAQAAGFGKVSLINDCTATALGYTCEQKEEDATFLVYSMGFIGFEVSLLRMAKGRLREISHDGSDSPSGRDFDVLVMAACVDLLKLNTKTYTDHWFDFRGIAAEAKHQLSVYPEATLSLPTYITGTEPKSVLLKRADFEQAIDSQVQASMDLVDRILKDANLIPANVDKVLLVGGSTRIACIQRQLEERFGAKLIQPRDDILAKGAAVQAIKSADKTPGPVYLPTEAVIGEHTKEGKPTPVVEEHIIQYREDEMLPPPVEPLFDYVRKLADRGAYEKADEFLEGILKRVDFERGELRKKKL